MLLRRIWQHVRTENWFAVFLDFIVVVVGLFIGLQIDTWWQARQEHRLEAAYLLELSEDFEFNRSKLENSTARLEEILRSIISLQQAASFETPNLAVPELNELFRVVIRMPTFIAANRAYSNLTGSGDLRLIQNRELKNALADYYATAELTMLVQRTHEMELVQIYEPYIIANLDYAAVQTTNVDDFQLPPPLDDASILKVIGSREFRNILTQKWVITNDLLLQHRGMMERTTKILGMLQPAAGQES